MFIYAKLTPSNCYHLSAKKGTICKLENGGKLTTKRFIMTDIAPPFRKFCSVCERLHKEGRINEPCESFIPTSAVILSLPLSNKERKIKKKESKREAKRKRSKQRKKNFELYKQWSTPPKRIEALPTERTAFIISDAFLLSFEWRKVRYEALKKNNGRCECCGQGKIQGIVLNVDHIKPRKKYPELAMNINNLQVLCSPCNHGKGNWDETDWRI